MNIASLTFPQFFCKSLKCPEKKKQQSLFLKKVSLSFKHKTKNGNTSVNHSGGSPVVQLLKQEENHVH